MYLYTYAYVCMYLREKNLKTCLVHLLGPICFSFFEHIATHTHTYRQTQCNTMHSKANISRYIYMYIDLCIFMYLKHTVILLF